VSDTPSTPEKSGLIQNSASTELASNRTSLSFERTHMAMDRTLMATVRTCFSLISFGFTINEVFQQLDEQPGALRAVSPHFFGLGLVLLGIIMLVMGIWGHRHFMNELARRKMRLLDVGLVRHAPQYQPTSTFITAVLLLALGIVAAGSIVWRSIL
jgi:putative membrane protein